MRGGGWLPACVAPALRHGQQRTALLSFSHLCLPPSPAPRMSEADKLHRLQQKAAYIEAQRRQAELNATVGASRAGSAAAPPATSAPPPHRLCSAFAPPHLTASPPTSFTCLPPQRMRSCPTRRSRLHSPPRSPPGACRCTSRRCWWRPGSLCRASGSSCWALRPARRCPRCRSWRRRCWARRRRRAPLPPPPWRWMARRRRRTPTRRRSQTRRCGCRWRWWTSWWRASSPTPPPTSSVRAGRGAAACPAGHRVGAAGVRPAGFSSR